LIINALRASFAGDVFRVVNSVDDQLIEGPLSDQIDLQVEAPSLPLSGMQAEAPGETSATRRRSQRRPGRASRSFKTSPR
jgi:hypothetical protein